MSSKTETRLEVAPGVEAEESQAFAEMLRRMYRERALKQGHAWFMDGDIVVVVHRADQDFARDEEGIHRLVRISPFDTQKRRHTSFVSVAVDGSCCNIQRRSYVLSPYKQVRDHLAGWVRDDVEAVLNGDWR